MIRPPLDFDGTYAMKHRCTKRDVRLERSKGLALALPCSLMIAAAIACETETDPIYGEPEEVVGATSSGVVTTGATTVATTSSSSGDGGAGGASGVGGMGGQGGMGCVVNDGCSVSFQTDLMPVLTGSCSGQALCHGSGEASESLLPITGDAAATYDALTAYVLKDMSGSYVVPCDVQASKLLCNLKLEVGENQNGICGSPLMPPGTEGVSDAVLVTFTDWIECGAPNN